MQSAGIRTGKNIVICADGTGNTAIKGRGTNVFKLYETVDQAGHRFQRDLKPQIAIYDDGVGTETLRWLALLTGATGWGLSRNVKQLYAELARAYAPGDQIYLFGFSRGAFTVRTLAGLIHACGILDLSAYETNADFAKAVDAAYAEYRRGYNSWLTSLFYRTRQPDSERVQTLRRRFSVGIPEFADERKHGKLIRFIGVWDTVDAVGLPIRASDLINTWIYNFKFPDRQLNTSIAHACHALALDEEREAFAPVLWDEAHSEDPARIEQVWFAGVHSNVGGGYPRQGMALSAFDWMLFRAEQHGLRFIAEDRRSYRYHGDVDDKMYDSRKGLGVFYRWQPRDVTRLCRDNGITPKVHRSVFERIARNTEGYAPGSLPVDPTIVSKSAPRWVTREIQSLVRDQHAGGPPLIQREVRTQRIGRWSYWMLVYGVLSLAGLTLYAFYMDNRDTTSGWLDLASRLTGSLASSRGIVSILKTAYLQYWLLASWLVVYMLVTFAVAMYVDLRLDAIYSEFWHRSDLRLKLRRLMFSEGDAPRDDDEGAREQTVADTDAPADEVTIVLLTGRT